MRPMPARLGRGDPCRGNRTAEQYEKGDRCVVDEHAADVYIDPLTIAGAKISLACNGIGGIVT